MAATESILDTTKEALGRSLDEDAFDAELIMHVNAALSNLTQLGIGPESGYAITSKDETWAQFMGDSAKLNQAKLYVYISVRLAYDPPSIGYVLTAYEKLRDEAAWRLTVAVDEPQKIVSGVKSTIEGIMGDELLVEIENPEGSTLINGTGTYEASFVPNGRDWSRPVKDLDASEAGTGKLKLWIAVDNGTYFIRSLTPRRQTVATIEVKAQFSEVRGMIDDDEV